MWYFDRGTGSFALQYDAIASPTKTALTITKRDTGRWQVSTAGGFNPVWSRDGHELFYGTYPMIHRPLVVVAVQTSSSSFAFGKPSSLFDFSPYAFDYAVSADGKKFLMIKNTLAATSTERPSLTIVTHWFDELKTRVK